VNELISDCYYTDDRDRAYEGKSSVYRDFKLALFHVFFPAAVAPNLNRAKATPPPGLLAQRILPHFES
jgi:hypothetical protein